MAAVAIWFLMIVREWVTVAYLEISMPPMTIPVMSTTMWSIIVRVVIMTGMVMVWS